jgi:hypothetical protein
LGPQDGQIRKVFRMKTVAPWQPMNLGRSIGIFFIVVSVAWIAANYVMLRDFLIGWPIIVGNVVVSGVAGVWWYRTRQHARFSWGSEGFELQRGHSAVIAGTWGDISQVSLVHDGYGRFTVRLYLCEGDRIDIPASDLRLDPSDFRFELMDLVGGGSQEKDSAGLASG